MIDAKTDDAFPVEWEDPGDAECAWQFDPVHTPEPVPVLSYDLNTGPFVKGFGWSRPTQVNYYVYFEVRPVPEAVQRATAAPDLDRLRDGVRKWPNEILPEVLRYTEHYRTTDFAALSDDALASEIERLPAERERCGLLHTQVLIPYSMAMNELFRVHRELTGGDDLAALRLVQGYGNKSVEAGAALQALSELVRRMPAVRARLLDRDGDPAADTIAALESQPDGQPFVDAFREYLDEWGWRSGGEFAERTWVEDPEVPLAMLRAYLETEGYDHAAEQRRLAEEREVAVEDTMAGLDDAGRARLREVLDLAVEALPLLEDHNYYLDQRLLLMPRKVVLASADRLVARGALEKASRVFHLRVGELAAALRGDDAGVRETADRRREELAHFRSVKPPSSIGAPMPDASVPEGAQLPDAASAAPREQRGDLHGTGVSAGVARGPARILAGLHEAGRLRPGDVLVTTATLPPWTPLFAVAAAVVTEIGGMLSHTATTAREYGIPAVVLPGATSHLRDGQLIEVDGAMGDVRVVA